MINHFWSSLYLYNQFIHLQLVVVVCHCQYLPDWQDGIFSDASWQPGMDSIMTSGKGEINNYKLPGCPLTSDWCLRSPTTSFPSWKDKILKSNVSQKEEDRFHKTFIHSLGIFLFLSKFVPSNWFLWILTI